MRAVIRIPDSTNYCLDCWKEGLEAAGYSIVPEIIKPDHNDALVIWNRSGKDEKLAQLFELRGAKVFVAENGYLGKIWNEKKWFAMSLNHHNGRGITLGKLTGRRRKAVHGFELMPWRDGGKHIVALPQRGIGEPDVAMPYWWTPPAWATKIRPHRGLQETIPLEDALQDCRAVVTWGSGAAIKAMAWGIPVFYDLRGWIGKQGATLVKDANPDHPQHGDRDAAFDDVFAGMFTLEEIRSGEPFRAFQ